MARGKKGRGSIKSKDKPKSEGDWSGEKWVEDLNNELFEKYYKMQNIISEEVWSIFMKYLREPLPTTFRIAGSRETAQELNFIIKNVYIPQMSDVTFEGVKLLPPVQLPWYPEGLAWHLNVSKAVLRKSPEFKRFHNFLVYETDVGNVSRQEAVSMLPPLFLDVEPHHIVMDMCAAPGSKTTQLLEALHTRPANEPESNPHMPSGLIVANDSDFKRTHLLVHQSSRLPSPALMVTNLDASNYPNLAIAPSANNTSRESDILKFDRILCDVPCSGDGTLRKNLAIWGHWTPMDGNGLHTLQLRILLRAMKLLKPQGRIVYSTCSLNPVENEAVVAAALKEQPDFELVDVSHRLTELVRKPGLDTWTPVVNKELKTFPSYVEFLADLKKQNEGKKIHPNQIKMSPTHWPPSDCSGLNLHRCMRIYPHLQDMGGFFVAVLQRKGRQSNNDEADAAVVGKRPASAEPEAGPDTKKLKSELAGCSEEDSEAIAKAESDTVEGKSNKEEEKGRAKKKGESQGKESMRDRFKEPPYTFLSVDHVQLQQTINRLSILPAFPMSNVFVRNPDMASSEAQLKSLYLCNDILKRVILANDYTKIRMVSAGTKIFTRQDAGASASDDETSPRQQFRILQAALSVILPFIPESTIYPGRLRDLRLLLEDYYPLLTSFEEPFHSILASKANGNQLVRFEADEADARSLNRPLILPLWKSNLSIALMLDKKSKSALSLRVFGEDITIFGKQILEKQTAAQARRAAAVGDKKEVEENEEVIVASDEE